jgi:lipopolysaccharide biosynthesis glycosyltransferase
LKEGRKYILGIVVDGSQYQYLSLGSIFSALKATGHFQNRPSFHEIRIVCDDKVHSDWKNFVQFIFPKTTFLSPSKFWENEIFPSMRSGSKATYWKFQLIESLQEEEILIYLDSDAFFLKECNLEDLSYRLVANENYSVLGVPSPRPNHERFPALSLDNAYGYINAGFYLARFVNFKLESLLNDTKELVSIDPKFLVWHDQDLLNFHFKKKIGYLPYSYNSSTGILNATFYSDTNLNHFILKEAAFPVIAHASGGVLLNLASPYPYRGYILSIFNEMLNSGNFEKFPEIRNEVEKMKNKIDQSRLIKLRIKILILLGWTGGYHPFLIRRRWHWLNVLKYLQRRIISAITGV